MEKIDPGLARAVWQRVAQARPPMPQPQPPRPNLSQPPQLQPQPPQPPKPQPPKPQPMPPIPVPPPPPPAQPPREEMRQWLAEVMALARGFRAVNAGRNTPLLRRMAAEEEGHYRQLAALYTKLYGRKPEVLSGAAAGGRSLAANLRDLYGAEQRAVRQWREAALRYPKQRGLFEAFALGDRRHAEQLARIMKNM